MSGSGVHVCKVICILSTLCCSKTGLSQHLFKLPAHTHLANVEWRDSIYRFSQFEYGKITLDTGYSPEENVMLNYNWYFLQMDMISIDGDTLQVKPIKELKLVTMGGHEFYHDYQIGYLEILCQGFASLGALNYLHTEKTEFHSGLGKVSGAIDVRGAPSEHDRFYKLVSRYYLLDAENKPVRATRRALVKLFKGHRNVINAYIEDNHVNFANESDLVRLLTFCNQLDQSRS